MDEIKDIRLFVLRHGYLLIMAAWLFTLAFLFNNYWSYYSSPQGVKRSLEESIQDRERSFYQLAEDKNLVNQLFDRSYDEKTLDRLTRQHFYVYAYEGNDQQQWETFWSSNGVQPAIVSPPMLNGTRFEKLKNGYYEVIYKNMSQAPRKRFLIGLIPVKLEYAINNNYLVDHFYDKPALGKEYAITDKPPGLLVENTEHQPLFYLHYNERLGTPPTNLISVALRVLACICVLVFINLFANMMVLRWHPWYGFLFLLVTVLFMRAFSYVYDFPFNLRALPIFTPLIYARDEIFRSLGDLLINVLLCFWLILFFREHLQRMKLPQLKKKWQCYLLIALACFLLYGVGQFLTSLIESLVIDSRISFDVTNSLSLNEYSVVGFVILGFISFSFLFFSQIINYFINELTNFQVRTKYIFLAFIGVIWLLFHLSDPELGYFTVLVCWLVAYMFLLDTFEYRFENSIASVPFLFWLFLLTITTSAVLVYYNNGKEITIRERMAENLSKQKDPYLEMLLGDVGQKLEHDDLIPTFFDDATRDGKRILLNALREKYFSGYLKRFNVTFYTYDGNGDPLFNNDTITLSAYNRDVLLNAENALQVSGNDLYFYERSFNDYSYIGKKEFANGYLVYELTPAVVNVERLYPELLLEGESDAGKENTSAYSYAVYDKGILVANYNDYPFPLRLSTADIPVSDISLKTKKGFSLLYYRAGKDKSVVVVKEERNFIEFITLFAWMFCLFLLIILVYKILDLLIRARMRLSNLKQLVNINIRRQVHGTIISVVVLAFLVLGATTILFFISRSKTENRERLSKNINEVAHDIEKDFNNQRMLDGGVDDLYAPIFQAQQSSNMSAIAEDRSLDINVYDHDGNLQFSTQPLMTEKGLLSRKMNPKAYFQLFRESEVLYIQEEKIGKLSYLSGYVPLRSNGTVYAYLNVPYFATETELKQQISDFLVALINFNAFIFLIAGILALLITNSITRSFTLVTEKLRQFNLGQRNDEIEWTKDDEIGLLVKEYNKMVRKLEVSVALLAKSEREGAWREMARQVAHEIKNPLTPMKLSIQYLQRAIAGDSPNVKELSTKVANTLVEQIEHLSNIASDFSAFAHIGESNNEKLLLQEVLQSLALLYETLPEGDVTFMAPDQPYYIFADKTQMNRLFTNLLQNAMQAIPEGRKGAIYIQVQPSGQHHVTVSIRDNGAGIPPAVQAKIFVPNFTTKSSGTGLGLAMCKNIVEQAHGHIWFETTPGEGTVFFVEIPLMNYEL
ncbi:His Kinase A (phospho-acceptor) domain-containing protein [Chitinophaga costaii]|uniref:histidine kinase n=1 Tax=Chitinophaga costaii TaxID=1335309 RepID=A0A1C4E984_9BACT|nr:HAMP domain-containing sensor histidine kinase [Chitinophaga costaii]PUZ24235.1 sensor histidine kinase [Chitinophaga costaii]SCC40169.1 His Kinase A (phospho-acceptor) domain-containing protein [Chitinophaga costaii]